MSLAIVLLNWHREQETLRCVHMLQAWRKLAPQLYVVDNESTEESFRALLHAVAADSVIRSQLNLGYAGGNNLGIRRALAAGHDYILLLNTDVEISEGDVSRLLATVDANPQIAILGPRIRERRDGHARLLVGGRSIADHATTRLAVRPQDVGTLPGFPLHAVDYVSGTVFLARAELFFQVGLLDEEYFFSGEIADFCRRAKTRGAGIFVDLRAEAMHQLTPESKPTRDTLHTYYSLRNRFLFVTKHHTSRKMGYFAFWTALGGLSLARAAAEGRLAKARAVILALVHAYTGHYGNQNACFVSEGRASAHCGAASDELRAS